MKKLLLTLVCVSAAFAKLEADNKYKVNQNDCFKQCGYSKKDGDVNEEMYECLTECFISLPQKYVKKQPIVPKSNI